MVELVDSMTGVCYNLFLISYLRQGAVPSKQGRPGTVWGLSGPVSPKFRSLRDAGVAFLSHRHYYAIDVFVKARGLECSAATKS